MQNMHMHRNACAGHARGGCADADRRAVASAAAARDDNAAALVFRTVLHGSAWVAWRGRRVRLDEDAWLVLAEAEPCSVWYERPAADRLLTVVVDAAELSAGRASLDGVDAAGVSDVAGFADSLRPIDGPVGRRLLAMAAARAEGRGRDDERSDRLALVCEAIGEERALQRRADGLACVKAATRQALLRRLLVAADFIATHHEEPLSLDEMAGAANLSRFHFVRLFKRVHGVTPHAWLVNKRTAVARRHLAGGIACGDACARAGFGSRSTLFRNLRKAAPAGRIEPCFPSA